jgi:hypothetical protein
MRHFSTNQQLQYQYKEVSVDCNRIYSFPPDYRENVDIGDRGMSQAHRNARFGAADLEVKYGSVQ